MRIRIAFATVVATLAFAAVGVSGAMAASSNGASPQVTDAGPLYTMPIAGTAQNGKKKFSGTYGIYKFVVKNNQVWSVGTLKGRLKDVTGDAKGRNVKRANVMLPASLTGNPAATTSQVSCPVLHLVLGPVNLNLLGLRVKLGGGPNATQEITLDITAQQGGGLLGDLLCGVTNALNGTGILGQLSTQLQQLAGTLNTLVGLLGGLQGLPTQP
jgi:hypothetical protein